MIGWRTAFILQANSDYQVFCNLKNQPKIAVCHPLHYLQMACEKLAKGFSCRDEKTEPQKTHNTLIKWIRTVKNNPHMDLMDLCRCHNKIQFERYIDSLLGVAIQVENLAPDLAEKRKTDINPEYPWRDRISDDIEYPANYPFTQLNLRTPKMIKLIEFIEATIQFGYISIR